MSSTQTWQCDTSTHFNPADINSNLHPSNDSSRPWKNHKVPEGSTVGDVLAQFPRGAKRQFLQDVETKARAIGCNQQETQAMYKTFLNAKPRGAIGTLVEKAFNKTFRTSIHEPLSLIILEKARSGNSDQHFLTASGEFKTRIKWHTTCAACSHIFQDGQRVVKMENGEWRHYWAIPRYGYTFTELFDTYRKKAEDGMSMMDGAMVSKDLTGTRVSLE